MSDQTVRRILFADDDPQVLAGLQSQVHLLGQEWKALVASSGAKALELLDQAPVEVAVVDALMPAPGGKTLLEEIVRLHPDTLRIVLSKVGDRSGALRLSGLAHQYLSKPCEPAELRETIGRAVAMRGLLVNRELQLLISQMETLPSLPALYQELVEEIHSDDPLIDRIGEVIARDMAMSAKILQLVNSAFFGLSNRVTHPTEAAMFLGIETVKSLVLSVQVFSQFYRFQGNVPEFSLERLWQHCWNTGVRARRLARVEHFDAGDTDQAFVSGLLHDVGELVLIANVPSLFKQALRLAGERHIPPWAAEKEVLGSSHAEVGAYLLSLWKFPYAVVEAVALHHRPGDGLQRKINCTTLVHVANFLDRDFKPAAGMEANNPLDLDYLRAVGAEPRLEEWCELAALTEASDS